MSRFGRRTFLASSAGVAAGAAVGSASTWPLATPDAADAVLRPLGKAGALAGASGLLRAGGLMVNGLSDPVGVDPDDCSFAWTVQARGRSVMQTAYRIVVHAGSTSGAGHELPEPLPNVLRIHTGGKPELMQRLVDALGELYA